MIVNEGVFKDSSVLGFLVIVAIDEAGSSVKCHFEKSLKSTKPQADPLAEQDNENEISLTSLQDSHKIRPTRKAIHSERFHSPRKPFGFLSVGDNHRIDQA